MRLSWLNDVPKENHKEFEAKVKSHREAWALLVEVLENRIQTIPPCYEDHSWAYRQADQNGYNKAIRETIDLLKSV